MAPGIALLSSFFNATFSLLEFLYHLQQSLPNPRLRVSPTQLVCRGMAGSVEEGTEAISNSTMLLPGPGLLPTHPSPSLSAATPLLPVKCPGYKIHCVGFLECRLSGFIVWRWAPKVPSKELSGPLGESLLLFVPVLPVFLFARSKIPLKLKKDVDAGLS